MAALQEYLQHADGTIWFAKGKAENEESKRKVRQSRTGHDRAGEGRVEKSPQKFLTN